MDLVISTVACILTGRLERLAGSNMEEMLKETLHNSREHNLKLSFYLDEGLFEEWNIDITEVDTLQRLQLKRSLLLVLAALPRLPVDCHFGINNNMEFEDSSTDLVFIELPNVARIRSLRDMPHPVPVDISQTKHVIKSPSCSSFQKIPSVTTSTRTTSLEDSSSAGLIGLTEFLRMLERRPGIGVSGLGADDQWLIDMDMRTDWDKVKRLWEGRKGEDEDLLFD